MDETKNEDIHVERGMDVPDDAALLAVGGGGGAREPEGVHLNATAGHADLTELVRSPVAGLVETVPVHMSWPHTCAHTQIFTHMHK